MSAGTLPSSAQYFEQLFYKRAGGCDRAWVALWHVLPSRSDDLSTWFGLGSGADPNCTVYMSGLGWECFDRFQYTPRTD